MEDASWLKVSPLESSYRSQHPFRGSLTSVSWVVTEVNIRVEWKQTICFKIRTLNQSMGHWFERDPFIYSVFCVPNPSPVFLTSP